MRKFYIFNINSEFKTLTHTNPYNLYKTFENLFYLPKDDYHYGMNVYENLVLPIDKKYLNKLIFDQYKNNDHYTKFMNTHIYTNYYSDEKTKLSLHNAFMTLETTSYNPTFLKLLSYDSHYFICDFTNQDYFWLASL